MWNLDHLSSRIHLIRGPSFLFNESLMWNFDLLTNRLHLIRSPSFLFSGSLNLLTRGLFLRCVLVFYYKFLQLFLRLVGPNLGFIQLYFQS